MSFSIREIICRLFRPKNKIICTKRFWRDLTTELQSRGHRVRESGAFILGARSKGLIRFKAAVYYDDLDPHALDTGIINFDGRYFGKLWEICRSANLEVVADIHTHPGIAKQSTPDKKHPMIARSGHISMILPDYANDPWSFNRMGIYRYLGSHKWLNIGERNSKKIFYVGL